MLIARVGLECCYGTYLYARRTFAISFSGATTWVRGKLETVVGVENDQVISWQGIYVYEVDKVRHAAFSPARQQNTGGGGCRSGDSGHRLSGTKWVCIWIGLEWL